jgi:hypothetical protein
MRASKTAIAVVSTIALATATVSVGTAQADPAGVGYSTTVTESGSVHTILDAGAFTLSGDGRSVAVVDDAGTVLTSIPLGYSVDGLVLPIDGIIADDGRSLTMTPQSTSLIHPVYSPAAYDNLVTQIQIGWQNGGSVSGGIGAGIGAVIGCVLFIFVGCIPGAAAGATIGVVNGITGANPAVTPAFFDFVRTLP